MYLGDMIFRHRFLYSSHVMYKKQTLESMYFYVQRNRIKFYPRGRTDRFENLDVIGLEQKYF